MIFFNVKNNQIFFNYMNIDEDYKYILKKHVKYRTLEIWKNGKIEKTKHGKKVVSKIGEYNSSKQKITFDKEIFSGIDYMQPIKLDDIAIVLEKLFTKKYHSLILNRYKEF
ncbi:MAG: hypothetical protein HRT98_02345 [Mycoplasmatales bacterium]|nr:hypothetical protein [Mycoplasmatales bacterium]